MARGSPTETPPPTASPADPQDVPVQQPWYYLAAMIALVAGAVALVEVSYQGAPIPPGVDPGHWLSDAYAYVGLPYPPAGGVGSPWVDPPFMFPVLGSVVLVTDNPLTAGFVYAGLMLGLYGLTVVHLARSYIRAPILQVLLVGIAIFNGTTLIMLFWGGYPNFTAFIFLNEAIVFFLLYVRKQRWFEAVVFYASIAMVYLTHSLTFAICLAVLGVGVMVLLLHRSISWRFLLGWKNLVGVGVLGAAIVGYTVATRLLHIAGPGYLFTNPAAYSLDYIGLVFNAVTATCVCPGDYLPTWAALFLLILIPIGLIGLTFYLARRPVLLPEAVRAAGPGNVAGVDLKRWPRFLTLEILIGVCWVSAAALVPAVGYFAHIDTDYSRFAYFFPLPCLLLMVIFLDRLLQPTLYWKYRTAPTTTEAVVSDGETEAPTFHRKPWSTRNARVATYGGVTVVVLVAIFASATPVVSAAESAYTGPSHDAAFLAAMHWLKGNPVNGSVLSPTSTTRWIQGLTARASYDNGPTWVLFYPFQIVNSEETYWALNSRYTISNNQVSYLYSGNNTTALLAQPMYTAIVEGVQFPQFRMGTSGTVINATHRGIETSYPPSRWGSPQLAIEGNGTPTGLVRYSGPVFNFSQVDQIGSGGQSWMNFSVVPQAGTMINSLSFSLQPPASQDPFVHAPSGIKSLRGSPTGFNLTTFFRLGELPGNQTLTTSGTFSVPAEAYSVTPSVAPSTLTLTFTNPDPDQPLNISISLRTPGTSNPAIVLPSTFVSAQYLAEKQIRFLLLEAQPGYNLTAAYFQAEFGFQEEYFGPQWIIYQR